jgi:signal transduction histidine kinase
MRRIFNRRFFNSLRVQLVTALVIALGLIAIELYFSTQTVNDLAEESEELNIASLQRSNAYLLASLVRRLDNTTTEAEIASLTASIQDTMSNIRQIHTQIHTGVREGDEELGLEPFDESDLLLSLLDTLEQEWDIYLGLVEQYLQADPETQEELLPQIETRSIIAFTFADRFTRGLEATLTQRADNSRQTSLLLAGGIGLAILGAFGVVVRAVTAINTLAQTANNYALGNLSVRATTETFTEVAQVASVFNEMTERIRVLIENLQELIKELEQEVENATAAQQRAERSDQVKSAFLASMSHELRTPLNAIINFTKFVAQGDLGPVNADQKNTLLESVDSAKHLLNLINDVLDMSKIESGSLNLFVREGINLTEILNNAISATKALIGEKSVVVETEIAPDLPDVRGDEQRIRQIVLNILSNAAKFTEEGHIKVKASHDNQNILIAVADSGPGIEQADYAAVFEAFRQTDTGLRRGGGTGLGMPISKSLAEIHGGRLWFESKVGEGTTFFVSLPIKSEELVPAIRG